MATKFFVIDLNSTEMCDTLEAAVEKANYWAQLGWDLLADYDDDEIAHMLQAGASLDGMECGDIEIYKCDEDDEEIRDYDGRISGRKIRDKYEARETISGLGMMEMEARKRGIIN